VNTRFLLLQIAGGQQLRKQNIREEAGGRRRVITGVKADGDEERTWLEARRVKADLVIHGHQRQC